MKDIWISIKAKKPQKFQEIWASFENEVVYLCCPDPERWMRIYNCEYWTPVIKPKQKPKNKYE